MENTLAAINNFTLFECLASIGPNVTIEHLIVWVRDFLARNLGQLSIASAAFYWQSGNDFPDFTRQFQIGQKNQPHVISEKILEDRCHELWENPTSSPVKPILLELTPVDQPAYTARLFPIWNESSALAAFLIFPLVDQSTEVLLSPQFQELLQTLAFVIKTGLYIISQKPESTPPISSPTSEV